MKKILKKVPSIVLLVLFFLGLILAGQTAIAQEICNPIGGCGGTGPGVEGIIGNLIDFIFKIALIVGPLMIVVGGFYIISSAGDTKKVTQGKQIITFTIIGLIIIMLSKALISFIREDILEQPATTTTTTTTTTPTTTQ